MGCNSSKQEVQEITKENQRPGKAEAGKDVQAGKDVDEYLKDAQAFSPVSTIDENMNGDSNILGEPVHKNANETSNDSVLTNVTELQPPDKSGVLNAWNAAPRGKAKPLKSIEHTQGVRHDTEYDNEGIDIYSTSLKVNSNLFFASRSSTDGIQVSNEEPHKWKVFSKDETEEAFNPSVLIDIEKFKAANAPASKKAHLFSGTTYSEEYHPDARSSAGSSKKAGWPASTDLVSPSDSNFYDEDEKELIENIERDYLGPQNVLPGAVE